ncbi:hypothetical protein [Nocardia brasiliensis]|uniref:hypothetical protein n=1 Tax=Nocardia brasiliensis TaxID=37326 RepID=UPI001933BBBF|nr:hypothetical protein [Nocardia brasiliensis]
MGGLPRWPGPSACTSAIAARVRGGQGPRSIRLCGSHADGTLLDSIADAVRALAEAGADTVVLQPTGDEPDPEGFVHFVAEQVRPLL